MMIQIQCKKPNAITECILFLFTFPIPSFPSIHLSSNRRRSLSFYLSNKKKLAPLKKEIEREMLKVYVCAFSHHSSNHHHRKPKHLYLHHSWVIGDDVSWY